MVSSAHSGMGVLDRVLGFVAGGLEVAAVAVILFAAVLGLFRIGRDGIAQHAWPDSYRRYRADLGRGILLGLELLLAADIIGTVAVTPSFESLAVLACIAMIRTFLSFALEIEVEGRLPWRRREAGGTPPIEAGAPLAPGGSGTVVRTPSPAPRDMS